MFSHEVKRERVERIQKEANKSIIMRKSFSSDNRTKGEVGIPAYNDVKNADRNLSKTRQSTYKDILLPGAQVLGGILLPSKLISKALGINPLAVLSIAVPSFLAYKTFAFKSKQEQHHMPVLDENVNNKEAYERLKTAIQLETISYDDHCQMKKENFKEIHGFLEKSYPLTHKTLKKEVVNDLSLLCRWEGKNKELKPILLMAHMDVVPVSSGTEKDWQKPPFSGDISDGYIWGRGTLDIKSSITSTMEAVENLIKKGFVPERTVYLAYGHDEEVLGREGGAKIAQRLSNRGVQLEYILDEGFCITEGLIAGIDKPIAFVGIAEKGVTIVELTSSGMNGHSSMPPKDSSVGSICTAVEKLMNHPMPSNINPTINRMFEYLGPEMKLPQKMVIANRWLTEGLVKNSLAKKHTTDALIRTTTAPTMLEGSSKFNVLPQKAKAVIDFRTVPGESSQNIVEHIKNTVNDPKISIKVLSDVLPSKISEVNSPSFRNIHKTIKEIFPNVIVAPSLTVGTTDSKHYKELTDNIFRFVPYMLKTEDIARMHGTNERISTKNYDNMIRFYTQLLVNTATN